MSSPQVDINNPTQVAFTFLTSYIKHLYPNYLFAKYHEEMAIKLMDVEKGLIDRLIIAMPPRHGKLLSDSTVLPTPKGWKKHGDLKIGDYVFGLDGKPTMINWISPKALATLEFEFTNGEKIRCHENHEWMVFNRSRNRWETNESKHFTQGRKLLSNNRCIYQLPLTVPLKFSEKNLPMHPYALGMWLGDGSSACSRICASYEDEIALRAVSACGYQNGARHIHNTTGVISQNYINGMTEELRYLNLINNKHIPDIYKFSSVEQRLELLAGLIDSDGSVEPKTSRVRITTSDPVLACDIKEIVRSFGWHVCHYKQKPCISTSGIIGSKEVSYLGFNPTTDIPTRVPRKEIQRFTKKRRIGLKSVRQCDPEPGHSISVESPDGMYLVGKTIIPTHNTMMVSEYFPAWYLGRNPEHQVIATTYSYERATDVGRKVRNQMLMDAYQEIFPDFTLSSDSKSANRLSSEQGGNYFSVGVGGAIAGRGADLFLIDDPIKGREEADSEVSRRKLIDWYRSVAYTRLLPGGRIVVISTRWHYDDLTGYLLEEDVDNWEVLKFPAIAEEDEPVIGRKRGEALWPAKYPIERLQVIRDVVGSREWNSLYQQDPIDEEGGVVKISWFKRYDEHEMLRFEMNPETPPFNIKYLAISWDTAFKESEINTTPSCATVWGASDIGFYLIDVFTQRMNFPKLKRKSISLYNYYSNFLNTVVLIEDKASGQSLIQVLQEETNIPIIKMIPDKGKVIRMESVSNVIEGGRVHIPNSASWLSEFERQISQFPLGRFKDIVDSTSQFLKWASRPKPKRKIIQFWK